MKASSKTPQSKSVFLRFYKKSAGTGAVHCPAAKSGASFAPCFWCIKPVTGFDFEQKTSLLQYIWALL
jgi:hypothetical protein